MTDASAHQMLAAADTQRQVIAAIMVTVEEPALLLPVYRVVGGIKIENDLLVALGQ